MAVDVLVLGQGPPPPDAAPSPQTEELRQTAFPAQRLWQGTRALVAAGLTVAVAAEGARAQGWRSLDLGRRPLGWLSLKPGGLTTDLPTQLVTELEPRCVVSLGPFAPARCAAAVPFGTPVFIDLPGDPMAEAQLRGEDDPGHLAPYHAVAAGAITRGDAFGVCSPGQRLALLGQLGLVGRLSPAQIGAEPVHVIPPDLDPSWLSAAPASAAHDIPPGPHIALIGSTNTWFDWPSAVTALDHALERCPESHVVVAGGAVEGFCGPRHEAFRRALLARPWASRVHLTGWMSPDALRATLDRCTAGLCLDRPCLEAELGARSRLLLGIARGLRWVVTPLSTMSRLLVDASLGLGAEAGDGHDAGRCLVEALELGRLSDTDRGRWAQIVPGAKAEGLVSWAAAPTHWPAALTATETHARLAAERELAAVRGTVTWRLLGALHRRISRS